MHELIKHLEILGYKRYRWSTKGYIEDSGFIVFSSVISGMIDVRFIKDRSEFIFGLHEKDKPPTLISPRIHLTDDEVNKYLQETLTVDVYNQLYQKSLKNNYYDDPLFN